MCSYVVGTNMPIVPYDIQSLRDWISTHNWRQRSLTRHFVTTSRACSAPSHYIISMWWNNSYSIKNDSHQMESSYRVGAVLDQFRRNWSRTANSITTPGEVLDRRVTRSSYSLGRNLNHFSISRQQTNTILLLLSVTVNSYRQRKLFLALFGSQISINLRY